MYQDENELFYLIDSGIDQFKKAEGFKKGIKVSKSPNTDWHIFNWRQLTWQENTVSYLIEIYPNFNENKEIISWTLYTAAYYDSNKKRYYVKYSFAEKTSLNFIAENIVKLLVDSYKFIITIPKSEIPFAVNIGQSSS